MKKLNQSKNVGAFIILPVALAFFVLLQRTQAVSPPPDGGYPGFNTAEGEDALLSLTSGTYNTAVGFVALKSNTTGRFNTAIGAGALLANTGDENTATGAGALLSNTTGFGNTATGEGALFFNTTGVFNTANGVQALSHNTTGDNNTAIGDEALFFNTRGTFNTATGQNALFRNSSGEFNTAIGVDALNFNTTGSSNIALGFNAGRNLTTGNSNIDIGSTGVPGEGSTIRIGGAQTKTFIAGIREVTTAIADAVPVVIDSHNQLGTASSSRRFKNEIEPMDKTSEAILALKPVTFQYKSDDAGTPQFGLIAEEVAAVNPDLVVHDNNGELYTVRYDAVNAMLLNEFLKAHRKMEEQEVTITQLTKRLQATASHQQDQIEALTEGLQKVRAQLEVNKPAPQTVNNP